MAIYIINLIIVFVCGYFSYTYSQRENVNLCGEVYINPNLFFKIILLSSMILCYAFRWRTGTDTPGYINTYYSMGQYKATDILLWNNSFFYLFCWIDYHIFQGSLILHNICLGIVTYVPILYYYEKYSKDYPRACVYAIITTFYYFSFNGQKQAVAVSVCLIAFLFFLQRKIFFSIIILLIATRIHTVSFVMFMIIPITHQKTKSPIFIGFVSAMTFSALFMKNLWNSMFGILDAMGQNILVERYATESSFYQGSNVIRLLVVLLPVIIGIWRYSYLSSEYDDFDQILNMNIMSCIWLLAGSFSWLFARMAQFTMPFFPVLLIRLTDVFSENSRKLYRFLVFILFFIYMWVYIHTDSNLLPYYFLNSDMKFY